MEHVNQILSSADEKQWMEEIDRLFEMHTEKEPPDTNTQLAASFVSAIHTILRHYKKERESHDKKRRLESVRGVINTLSFSELEAVKQICRALDGGEGLLIAGHIADELGFTRSVVVNALRKLEGAGAAETRSLGMKGTFIRIKDPMLAEELRKL
jgi:transcriptional pleiotropic repressor